MKSKIGEKSINKALAALSWPALRDHISTLELDDAQVDEILELVRINESLVTKRDAPTRVAKRRELLSSLADFLENEYMGWAAADVRSLSSTLDLVDESYQGILTMLAKTDAAAFQPEKRVSALLSRSNREYAEMQLQGKKAIERGELHFGQVTLVDEHGREFNVGAYHTNLVEALGSTIAMEAHVNKWFDDKGIIVLPSLPATTAQDEYSAGTVQYFAVSWRNWQRAEQRHRYLDGKLVKHMENLSPGMRADGLTCLVESTPTGVHELYDYVANIRLDERLKHEFLNMAFNETIKKRVVGIEGQASLLPVDAVSVSELHGGAVLSQLLASPIAEDLDEFAGLRLVEWLRGYAVLQCIVETRRDVELPQSLCLHFTENELVGILQRLGFSEEKARLFIEHTTFKRDSRDMFDHPLLRMQDGSVVIVGLAVENSSFPRLILSALGTLEVNLDGKGKRFERYIINWLQKRGFDAKGFRCKRGDDEYDYDAAFVWGDYAFFLECKSNSLSNNEPVASYRFGRGINSSVEQVKRLAEGLENHPDILEKYMPEAVGKKRVFCVMNALPYSVVGGIEGIYFTDESSFGRFFTQPQFGERNFDRQQGLGAIKPGRVLASLWQGSTPTPEDLLRHLENPVQVRVYMAHTEPSHAFARLAEGTLALVHEYGQTNLTTDSLRSALSEAGFVAPKG